MKAATIPQPHASLLAAGTIHVVTRTEPAPQGHLGVRVAIHAAKRAVRNGYEGVVGADFRPDSDLSVAASKLPRGAVIATAILAECMQMRGLRADGTQRLANRDGEHVPNADGEESDDGVNESSVGCWWWCFRDVEMLPEPVPARGHSGLWEWEGP